MIWFSKIFAKRSDQAVENSQQLEQIRKKVCLLCGDLYALAGQMILDNNPAHESIGAKATQADEIVALIESFNGSHVDEPRRLVARIDSSSDPARPFIVDCLRTYILAKDALRKNPTSWKSCHPLPDTEEGREYKRVRDIYERAESALWAATDIEYDDSDFRDAVWNWRYWRVMARKCCWYQRFGTTFKAGQTMHRRQAAETRFVEVCGLSDIYRTANSYIEERFPNLRQEKL